MASTIRRHVIEKLGPVLSRQGSLNVPQQDFVQRLAWCIRVPGLKKDKKNDLLGVDVHIPYKFLQLAGLGASHTELSAVQSWASTVVQDMPASLDVKIEAEQKAFHVKFNHSLFIKAVLSDISRTRPLSNLYRDLAKFTHCRVSKQLKRDPHPQNVLVEYSSPNIAKLFHAGHLRSTVQGNVLANIYQYLGHNVTRINYLGDWGTQFGYIGIGLKKYSSDINPEESAVAQYYQVYVQANKESIDNPQIHEEAKQFFHRMEQGGEEELKVWKKCRDASIEEYKHTYKRLGVHFDVYEGESMYKDKALKVVENFRQKGLVHTDTETGVEYLEVKRPGEEKEEEVVHVKLLKSDGTTLYVTRDIAAAMDRYERYAFHRLLYVVDEGQNRHFTNVLTCLQASGQSWAIGQSRDRFHVGFGRVQEMSSRRGEVVFLKDILDEARTVMAKSMREKNTTKVADNGELEEVADQLGVSAIVVQDLKFPRMKPYTFQWENMLRFTGNTGVFIQYTHARLCSLERMCRNNSIEVDPDCDTHPLTEPQALNLALTLAGFDEALYEAYTELQPWRVVDHLFDVCHQTGSAFHSLNILDQPKEVAQARLLLFHCARLMIAEGLQILSLTPLERM